jgi:GNAT superfamily N-acetyltransferase
MSQSLGDRLGTFAFLGILPLGLVHAIRQRSQRSRSEAGTDNASSAPPGDAPKPPLSPDWRSTVSRIAAADDGFPATTTALQGVFDAVAAAFATPDLELHITSMAPDDDDAKDFVVQGYVDVRQAEGAKASRPELDFVRAGLEAGHGGVLLCRAEDKLVGYLWWVDTEKCPYGPGCYADKAPFLWVHTVYTVPAFRRRGVARALHGELEKIARRLKRASIWLDVYANNAVSKKLHDNLGFAPVTVVQRKLISL